MHHHPLVSVVIPMYQSEATIQRALTSVVRQTYRPMEVILVNDGSTDASVSQAESYMASHQEEQLSFQLLDQANGGASKARNTAMRQASGRYIALLDADDEWVPDKIAQQIAILEAQPSIDFLGTTRNGERWTRWFFKKFDRLTDISARLLLYKTFFATPTVIFKRSVLSTVGYFDEQQYHSEDANYWIRICKDHHCVLLNESLVLTGGGKPHIGHSGLSSDIRAMAAGEIKNMALGYRLGIVGRLEYLLLLFYCKMKYFRRILVVKSRKK
ncbi:glycosyltransferase family 2 protein [Olivibacter sp. SDN3]|uniref:glycosyltransferase family 2 protein n=1 Tax=Olivibacter sp. SDN3 TaxID=2764720 RepID=UPI0016515EB6|nr:glycosyltransferase family 2 protein [Olivibacter sp. SDN3]QNL51586.1 glycosyltransferase family 2 protein [Olivibacter sp. SDN3]